VFAGDVLAAGYQDKQFDMVASFEVLEHLSAPLRYLREFWRVTRPGGLLLLTTPNFNGLSRRCLGVQWRVVAPEHLGYFTPATLSRSLGEAGYQRVYVRARSLDVLSWRQGAMPANVVRFDPYASARLRDRIEADEFLRLGKAALNCVLGMTGLGDSLLAWAYK
jgi:2-polyprenyl-3-methyl-5-hydroxy-6-metoxy-1,4-benzoquinol methylase